MIKRLGIFTFTIITGFFVFGSGVFAQQGSVSCGIEYTGGVLSYKAEGLQTGITYSSWVNDGDENYHARVGEPDKSGKIAEGFSPEKLGTYTFYIREWPDGRPLCSPSVVVNSLPQDKQLGQICNPHSDNCAEGQCLLQQYGSGQGQYRCALDNTPVEVLKEGQNCIPNVKPFCDAGLECVEEYAGPNITYVCKEIEFNNVSTGANDDSIPFDAPEPVNIPQLVNLVIKFSVGVAGVVAFFLLVVGGFKFMMSRGDPAAIQSAQETISSAIAGLVLIILAVSIFGIMSGILQIPGIGLVDSNLKVEAPNIPGD